MKKIYLIGFIGIVCLVALPFGAFAIPITGEGSSGSSFKGSLTYNVYDSSATLQVTLAISSPTQQAYLGGFSFTNESILKASMETTGNFVLSGSNGSFQVLAGNIAQNTLGDIAQDTIQQQEVNFFLYLGGYNLKTLTEESFLQHFVVLMSDSTGRVTDKVPVVVSEPSTMLLLGFGLLVIGVRLRKKT
jgi:hypothetical protein